MNKLVLASGSPRRAELIRQIGVAFRVIKPEIDETPIPDESASDYVQRMSQEKYTEVMSSQIVATDEVVLCADTVVIVDGDIMGKPVGRSEACEMLMRLSGREHIVTTSVTIGNQLFALEAFTVETIVKFRTLNLSECYRYWQTGEPQDKAGGYGIQGLGAIFVASITGSYSNVVGLPLMETSEVLATFGISALGV